MLQVETEAGAARGTYRRRSRNFDEHCANQGLIINQIPELVAHAPHVVYKRKAARDKVKVC